MFSATLETIPEGESSDDDASFTTDTGERSNASASTSDDDDDDDDDALPPPSFENLTLGPRLSFASLRPLTTTTATKVFDLGASVSAPPLRRRSARHQHSPGARTVFRILTAWNRPLANRPSAGCTLPARLPKLYGGYTSIFDPRGPQGRMVSDLHRRAEWAVPWAMMVKGSTRITETGARGSGAYGKVTGADATVATDRATRSTTRVVPADILKTIGPDLPFLVAVKENTMLEDPKLGALQTMLFEDIQTTQRNWTTQGTRQWWCPKRVYSYHALREHVAAVAAASLVAAGVCPHFPLTAGTRVRVSLQQKKAEKVNTIMELLGGSCNDPALVADAAKDPRTARVLVFQTAWALVSAFAWFGLRHYDAAARNVLYSRVTAQDSVPPVYLLPKHAADQDLKATTPWAATDVCPPGGGGGGGGECYAFTYAERPKYYAFLADFGMSTAPLLFGCAIDGQAPPEILTMHLDRVATTTIRRAVGDDIPEERLTAKEFKASPLFDVAWFIGSLYALCAAGPDPFNSSDTLRRMARCCVQSAARPWTFFTRNDAFQSWRSVVGDAKTVRTGEFWTQAGGFSPQGGVVVASACPSREVVRAKFAELAKHATVDLESPRANHWNLHSAYGYLPTTLQEADRANVVVTTRPRR